MDENFAWRDTRESREYYLTVTQDEIWKQIICEYSKRNLTLFDDRLPALAGIATELAKSWNDVYLAGFWKKTITRHLGWFRRTGNSKNLGGMDCTKRIGSPSLSWVTAPYSVSVKGCEYPDAKLIDSGVLPESQKSPFGKVKDAFIALEARVLRALDLDLDLTIKFKYWLSPPYDDSIGLDFEVPRPDLDNCRLVYLRQDSHSWMFLVVEQFLAGKFRRVGYTELSKWREE